MVSRLVGAQIEGKSARSAGVAARLGDGEVRVAISSRSGRDLLALCRRSPLTLITGG